MREKESPEMTNGGFSKNVREESLTQESNDFSIKVDTTAIEKEISEIDEVSAPSPEVQEVNAVLIEAIATVTGRTLALLTSVEEMKFDEQEINQLIKIWTPVLPTISPLAVALLGTTAIVSSKVAINVVYRKTTQKKQKEEHV